jgi:ABC-type multidrug transport system fused ATPase/permease subunit
MSFAFAGPLRDGSRWRLSKDAFVSDLYFSLPMWLSTALVLGVCVAVGVGGRLAAAVLLRTRTPRLDTELASVLMTVTATFIGIMLAFSAVQVWEAFREADQAVAAEAESAAQLYRDLRAYGEESRPARQALTAYATSVVDDEWPRMKKDGVMSPKTADALVRVFDALASVEPATPRQTVIYNEALTKLNAVVEHRRSRLLAAHTTLPALFWVVVLIGSAIIIAYTATYPATPLNLLLIAGLAVSLGLIFVFIIDVQHPFDGWVSISPDEVRGLPSLFAHLEAR